LVFLNVLKKIKIKPEVSMYKKTLLLVLSIVLITLSVVGCEGEVTEGKITEAPSGARDVDIKGKTFVSEKMENVWEIEKETTTYSVDGSKSESTETVLVLAKSQYVLTFNADGTYTVTEEVYATDKFTGDLTYVEDEVETESDGTVNKSLDILALYPDGPLDFEESIDLDTIYMNYLYASYSSTTQKTTYTRFANKYSYTGYADQLIYTAVITGTWTKFEIPTSGFEAVTYGYHFKDDAIETNTFYSVEPVATGWKSIYFDGTTEGSEYTESDGVTRFAQAYDSSKTITVTKTDVEEGGDLGYFEKAYKNSDGKQVYKFGDYFYIEKEDE
jgi:hypothetical protein